MKKTLTLIAALVLGTVLTPQGAVSPRIPPRKCYLVRDRQKRKVERKMGRGRGPSHCSAVFGTCAWSSRWGRYLNRGRLTVRAIRRINH
jgi:hypothetical protein